MKKDSEKAQLVGESHIEIDRVLYQAIVDALIEVEDQEQVIRHPDSFIAKKLNIQPLLVRRVRDTEKAKKRRLDQEK